MDSQIPLPPEIWERIPPEAQAYIRALESRVAALEATIQQLREQVQETSQRADEPLADGVGLRALWRCFQDPQPQMAHLLIELWGEDAVPIMDQEAVGVVRWDRVAQLLQGP